MRRLLPLVALLAAGLTPALAQDGWPNRPIKAITTTSAGGLSDIFMRALGEELRQRLGQPLVIENRPGGAMNTGTRACADSAPDGYTICITNADAMLYNQFLFKSIPGYRQASGGITPGRVTVTFELNELGRMQNARATGSSVGAVDRCVAEAMHNVSSRRAPDTGIVRGSFQLVPAR